MPTEAETRICKREGCVHKGEPQPIDRFPLHRRGNCISVDSWCMDCHREFCQEWRLKRKHHQGDVLSSVDSQLIVAPSS